MRLSDMALPDFPRAAIAAFLRGQMTQHGIDPANADLITDLAIHAAERGRMAILQAVEPAPSVTVQLSALHLALSLIQLDAKAIAEALERAGGDKTIILQEGTTHG